jgi:hypothetical protein
MVMKKKKGGGHKVAAAPGEEQPALQRAVRGKKKTGDDTIRGLTQNESLKYSDLVDLIRGMIR